MVRHLLPFVVIALSCMLGWYSYTHAPGTAYTSEGLAAYVATERLDPIFALEGTDPDKLRSAVDGFFVIQDRIAAHYQGDDRAAVAALYPADFLRLLPDLEASRQSLLKDPTIDAARAYHALLVRTIHAYADDAKRIALSVRSAQTTYPSIDYLGGAASPSDVAQKIDATGSAALNVQLAKEQARFACLSAPEDCSTVDELLAQRREAVVLPQALPTPDASVQRVAALTQKLDQLYRSFARTGPVLLTIQSTCVPSSTVAYMQPYYLSNWHGLARKLSPVGDAYFYDIDALRMKWTQTPEYGALKDAGILWLYQNAGNLYECPDAGYDQATASSLLGVLEWLNDTSATSSEARAVRSLRNISKADVAPYIKQLATIDSPATNAVVERYLEGSSDFDQVVLGALNDNGFMLASTTAAQMPPRYQFVVTTRNFASTMLLMGNPTFVPEPQSLFSSHTAPGLGNFYLRSYLHDLSLHVTDQTLIDQYRTSLDIQYPTTP